MKTVKLFFLWVIVSFSFFSCKAQQPKTFKEEFIPADTTVSITQNSFSIDYLMGKFDPATHPDFVVIPALYRDEEIRYIRKDVLGAFIKMYDAAAQLGIYLKIRSATRNFENQKRIWENKWTGRTILEDNVNAATQIHNDIDRAKKILQFSSMPGSSRHHWGTDIDINSFINSWFESGEGLKLYEWMSTYASKFGFCQPYTKQEIGGRTGYFEEKWHWSYMPVSGKLTAMATEQLTNQMISGFLGAETAKEIDVVKKYILGIGPSCLQSK
ncbi:MAG: M15 family metallopeptidase [Saprospiraceae bacterium]|nr:M15 family metallopeptidase [Saprospiraceae bacterium]